MSRRRWLAALGSTTVPLTAGCIRSDTEATAPPCADAFQVTEERAQLGKGVVPVVELQLANVGSTPIGYDLLVVFQQGTSLGIDARTGRAQFAGALGPDETRKVTATDDGKDAKNTQMYELEVELRCRTSATPE
ncbi:hypothetical protein [Halosegnis sp.]|uniref:hypothetical protein n=1 Tax=Halosegnis sp. TaxID=2864959 RepID=UPI0035D44AE8